MKTRTNRMRFRNCAHCTISCVVATLRCPTCGAVTSRVARVVPPTQHTYVVYAAANVQTLRFVTALQSLLLARQIIRRWPANSATLVRVAPYWMGNSAPHLQRG